MSVSLSVVVPCFNAAAYLDAALRSVALQAVPDVEVIVIDDGSTDGSAEIARRHSPSVRLVQQENQGISASRNRGIELSRGEIVGFLDADDLLPPESLRSRFDVLASFPEADGATGLVRQFISPELNPKERAGLEVSLCEVQTRERRPPYFQVVNLFARRPQSPPRKGPRERQRT